MSTERISSVGMIGLGKMGNPIVRNLAGKGFTVNGCDISADAVKAAQAHGIKAAPSPAAVAAASDLVIVQAEADAARMPLPLCGVIKEVIKGIKAGRGEA